MKEWKINKKNCKTTNNKSLQSEDDTIFNATIKNLPIFYNY